MNKPAIINWIYIHLIDNHPTPLLTPYTLHLAHVTFYCHKADTRLHTI